MRQISRRALARGNEHAGRLVEAALRATPYRFRAGVRFVTNPEEPRKRVAPGLGFVEPCETGSLLHIGADNTAWLASYLTGLDLSFEALRPAELRADLHHMGVRLAGTHELASRQEGVNHTPSDPPVPEEGEPPHQAH